MNFFCRLLGHTWVPQMRAPDPRWNTTKDGIVLEGTAEGEIRYVEICQRCHEEREVQLKSTHLKEV